jgi:hypothetical protein
MRFDDSTRPDDVDPTWPPEMVLIVTRDESALTELLFIRDSWRLRVDDHLPVSDRLPDLDPAPEPAATTFSDSELISLGIRWSEAWQRAIAWSVDAVARQPKIQALAPGDTDALLAILPPRWTEALDDERFDQEEWFAWRRRLPPYDPPAFADLPERRSLAALVPAWRRGLETIIVLPLAGPFSRRIAPNALLLSHTTYETPEEFTAALSE